MGKQITISKLIIPLIAFIVSLVLFFFSFGMALADTTTGLSLQISSNGDIPEVSIPCTNTHNYTTSLVHRDGNIVQFSFGVIERKYCNDSGLITFSGFNLNNLLTLLNGPSWWLFVHPPLEYIIKDTTGLGPCNASTCLLGNLEGSFNNFDHNVALASSTYWTTVGAGPVFNTNDLVTWFNTANGDGSVNYASTTPTCCSNVLFIPGLEASRLYEQKTVLGIPVEDQLWEPNADTDVLTLYLNSNGNSIDPNIYTKDIIGTTNVLPVLFTENIYKSLILNLDNLISTNKINSWKAYAYDWRQGVDDLVQNGTRYNNNQIITLLNTLQSLVASSKNAKVSIISHSNGGLITKALIKKLEDMKSSGQNDLIDHIDNIILIASPQLGTPYAITSLLHGYNNSILGGAILNESQARKLAQNMPSAYGLLPSSKYFDQTGIVNPVVFSSTSPQMYKNTYGSYINNYLEERSFVLGQEGRSNPLETDLINPIIGNNLLFSKEEDLHTLIDNMTIPASINVIDIAGWGKETIAGVTYTGTDIEPIFTFNGDATVVSQSALFGFGTKYWLDLSQSKLEHKNILEDPQLLSFIKDIIEQSTTTPNLSSTEPSQTGNRLHLSVHSPVSIGVYDNQNNFTGKVCDSNTGTCVIKEDIPGSTYLEFGEGKYLNIPEGDPKNINIKGTGSGTFTFNIDEFHGDNHIVGTTFKDIPVNVTTNINLDVQNNIDTLSSMHIDKDGNGTVDLNLNPKFGGVVTVASPLTVSADKKTIRLGSAIPILTATLGGFINGDTLLTSDVTGTAGCITTATNTSTVGIYPIICSIGSLFSNNYSFSTFASSTLTINYRFDGFLQPINDTTYQIGQVGSVFKAGSTIPVKFQLKKADGTLVQAITSPVWLTPQPGSKMSSNIDESTYSDPGTSGNTFKWDSASQQYIYNWNTKGLTSGLWYKISAMLNDGNIYSVTVGLR